MKRAYIFGASLAVIMGCITWGLPIRHDMRWLLALAVSLIAWRLFRRKVASKGGVRPGTRKWARLPVSQWHYFYRGVERILSYPPGKRTRT